MADAGLEVQAELTDPLRYAHHAFFARGRAARAARGGQVGGAGRGCTAWRRGRAETLFTVHYAVLARRP